MAEKSSQKATKTDQAAAEQRNEARVESHVRTIVQVKESSDVAWKEVVDVSTVSRIGAGFELSKPTTVGRLVTLVMPMPPEYRVYGHDDELYPIMGLVQYCNEVTVDNKTVYHTGVGFIGKDQPESYKANPAQNYRISGMNDSGLWDITEAGSQFVNRRSPRFWVALPVTVSLLRRSGHDVIKETTHTKEIGKDGVSVVCSLEAAVGDIVKFACDEYNFYATATVRNRKVAAGQPSTLHLEFVEAKFPVKKLPQYESATRESDNTSHSVTETEKSSEDLDQSVKTKVEGSDDDPSGFEFSRY